MLRTLRFSGAVSIFRSWKEGALLAMQRVVPYEYHRAATEKKKRKNDMLPEVRSEMMPRLRSRSIIPPGSLRVPTTEKIHRELVGIEKRMGTQTALSRAQFEANSRLERNAKRSTEHANPSPPASDGGHLSGRSPRDTVGPQTSNPSSSWGPDVASTRLHGSLGFTFVPPAGAGGR